MKKIAVAVCVGAIVLACISDSTHAQWGNATKINESWERARGDIKTPQIDAASGGGFHVKYFVAGGTWQTKYRRYQSGVLGSAVLVEESGFRSAGDICEGLNGTLHMVWEDWNLDSPQVGWARSTNGGASWSYSKITTTGDTKFPYIAPFGFAPSADIIMSFWQAAQKSMQYKRYNGSSWTAETGFAGSDSEYQVMGTCRSPADGSVWRAYGRQVNGVATPLMKRYNGAGWDAEVAVEPTGFFARQSVAANSIGQVMYVWERDSVFYSKLYTPGGGWGGTNVVQTGASHGMVISIPGSNNFYAVYMKDVNRVRGRLWSGGGWLPEETISNGQAAAFGVDAQVAAGVDGSLYCCWEYWGDADAPNAYYSVRTPFPAGAKGTLAGVVRDQYGVGVPGAVITVVGADAAVAGAGGAFSFPVSVGTYTVTASKEYFNAQSQSGVTITEGQTTTRNFTITGTAPAAPGSFTSMVGGNTVHLQYQKPSSANYSGSVVRYKTTGYPTGPTDGTLLLDRAGTPSGWEVYDGPMPVGARYYFAVYAYFQDASRYYSGSATTTVAVSGPADADADGDVDLDDFSRFQTCFNGPNRPAKLPGSCGSADLDSDGDVDLMDFGAFQRCFNGPNRLPVYNCWP